MPASMAEDYIEVGVFVNTRVWKVNNGRKLIDGRHGGIVYIRLAPPQPAIWRCGEKRG